MMVISEYLSVWFGICGYRKPEFINPVNMHAKFEANPLGEEDGVAVDKENAPGETVGKELEDKVNPHSGCILIL